MSDMTPDVRLALAEAIARDAADLALDFFNQRQHLTIESKGPQDMVSIADRSVETRIRERLATLFPDDGIIGEEHAPKAPKGDAGHWVIDPIDGTWCFVNGIQSWCVSVAYERAGQIEIGVIADPCSGEVFAARRGGGATLNGKPIRVADAKSLADGSVSVGFSTRCTADQIVPVVDAILRQGGVYHRHGSGALGLAWTACGRLIGYVEPHINSWDCLAGLLLIEEAGGWVNDFLADDGLRKGNPILACAPALRPTLEAMTTHWKR